MLNISGLFIYPIKSLAGIAIQSAKVTDRGLEHDRRWMLIDSSNRFLSQREIPEMALFKPEITLEGLKINHTPSNSSLLVPFKPADGTYTNVTIWDDTCPAQYVCREADEWFSRLLKIPCRLVYMPDNSHRQVDPDYASPGQINSFSDGYPFLIISEASIADLSERIGENIPMNRFRPNIVINGGAPYCEDEMTHFIINNIDFYGVKICARCPVPGIDQQTATRHKEPLKTLAGYRRRNNKIYMGQNLLHRGEGNLHIGDQIHVLDTKPAPVFG